MVVNTLLVFFEKKKKRCHGFVSVLFLVAGVFFRALCSWWSFRFRFLWFGGLL